MSDTYFVLMEPDDLKPWHDGMLPPTSENPKLKVHKDDLSDFVFLFDSETTWKRVEKDQIQIQNRSRKLRLEFKKNLKLYKLFYVSKLSRVRSKTLGQPKVILYVFERLQDYLRQKK